MSVRKQKESTYHKPSWAVQQITRHDRLDRCVEDICEHGVGHPNLHWLQGEKDEYAGIHGCDGCCGKS